ncbi:hypothetical protein EAF00_007291 [Botryotinia globosa]|nr:hypothetical protein EAF00_007291 [Botryotinia globosa]
MWKGGRDLFRAALEQDGLKQKDIEGEINAIFLDIDADHIANIKLKHDSIRARSASEEQKYEDTNGSSNASGQYGTSSTSCLSGRKVGATTTELRIKVDIKTLGVFTSMYSDPDGGQDTGSVSWKDFRRAMRKAGFESWEGRGSAVEFQPAAHLDWGDSKKIGCHRPHPDPYFDLIQLRGLGKRLNKHFGFNGDPFILKE